MLPKDIFNCFKLCLLVVTCTAAPSRGTTSKWPNNNYDDPFRLPDVRTSDAEADFNISGLKLKGHVREKSNNENSDKSVADMMQDEEVNTENDVPIANKDSNDEDKINFDEKNDISGAGVQSDNVDEINSDEKRDNLDEKLTDADNANNTESQDVVSQEYPIDKKRTNQDQNDVVPPSPSQDNEEITQNLCKLWGPGKIGVKYDMKKLSSLASFKLSSTEMNKFKIWPKATIPFLIDEFSYGKVLRDKIRDYLDHAGSLSGLNFQELPNPPEDENERWVFIVNRRGQLDCNDYSPNSFTNSGVQKVVIGYDCLNNNGHMAALVLALAGVPPQHNSPDRDRFVNVSMESILPEKRHLFKRLNDGDWLFHDLGYDYDSAGHYPSHKHTADGSSTIKVLSRTIARNVRFLEQPIEEQDTFSDKDLQKIRMLYNNILQNSPYRSIKSDTCQALYRTDPNSGGFKLNNHRNVILERPKPKKYLAEVAKDRNGGDQPLTALKMQDMRGEVLSDIER